MSFSTMRLPADPTVTAPDGSDVRILLSVRGASMAHFELAPGAIAAAVRHRTVDEVWFVVGGTGRIWRDDGERAETVELSPGVCIDIPVGTSFQFRCDGQEPLGILGCTSPPWPGEDEAEHVGGPWVAS